MVYSAYLSGSLGINFEYTHASGVESENGLLCSPKWFAVYQFGIHTCLRGGINKWFTLPT